MNISTFLLVFALLLGVVRSDDGSGRLFKDLFSTYSTVTTGQYRPLIRPVQKYGENVTVQLGLALVALQSVNFEEQSLTSSVRLVAEWTDPSLRWKPINYGGVAKVVVPVSMIWAPDITVYNELNGAEAPTRARSSGSATVDSNGQLLWIIPTTLKTVCDLPPKAAIHECTLRFGSWTHILPQVDFQPRPAPAQDKNGTLALESIDTTSYLTGKQWTIEGTQLKRTENAYPPVPDLLGAEIAFTIRFSATKISTCRSDL